MMSPELCLGLIGYPLEHSLSPALHQAALQALGIPGQYHLYSVSPLPDGLETMKTLIQAVRAGQIHGLNITIPHKIVILPFLDDITPAARRIGAVNTIGQQNGFLVGENTDSDGFITDLCKIEPDFQNGAGKEALILGAGGAARAVAFALISLGYTITVTSSRSQQVQKLIADIKTSNDHAKAASMDADTFRQPYCLIVNATPVGMFPNMHATPWRKEVPFPPGAFIYDLIYNPTETRLVRDARLAGLKAVNGLGMLVEQAALSFKFWSGQTLLGEIFWNAIFQHQAAPADLPPAGYPEKEKGNYDATLPHRG
jgi:shikimate dehydrogenase